jgi:hypothetical protein
MIKLELPFSRRQFKMLSQSALASKVAVMGSCSSSINRSTFRRSIGVESYGDNGVAGGRLGFNTQSIIPGYGVEFDGWAYVAYEFADILEGKPNPSADPSNNHIELVKYFTGGIDTRGHLGLQSVRSICSLNKGAIEKTLVFKRLREKL